LTLGRYLEHESLVNIRVAASELYVRMGAKDRFNGGIVQESLNPPHFTVTHITVFGLVAFLANIVWVQPKLLAVVHQNAKLNALSKGIYIAIYEPGRIHIAVTSSKAPQGHWRVNAVSASPLHSVL